MENIKQKSTLYFIVGIIIIAFILTIPFWLYGVPRTSDSIRHFIFASSVYDSLSEGNIYIQGEPAINNGYGGYALRFYPVFTYYSLAVVHFITDDWHNAAFLFFWLWMSIGGVGLYFFAREWLDEKLSFIAAALYMLEPYHNAQIHNSYADAEFVAGSLLTFCFLFVIRVIKYGKLIDITGLAFFYGLLLISHIPLAIIGSFCLFVFGFYHLVFSQYRKECGLKLLAGFTVGVSAASFYLIRLFSELSWINHSSNKYLNQGGFNYQFFFVDIRGFFFPSDLVLFNFLILLIPPIIIIFLKSSKEAKKSLYPLISVTIFSIFMSTSLSQIIWENIETLQKIQFPWRWLTIASIGYGIIICVSILNLKSVLGEKKLVLTVWTLFFIIASSYFTYFYIIGANYLDVDYFLISNERLNNVVRINKTAPYHEFWQTIWTKKTAFEIKEKIIANERNYEISKWEGFDKKFTVSSGEAIDARIAVSYYPHWKAKVNEVEVAVSKTEDGAIVVPIPKEESIVELNFVEPPIVKIALYLSAISWLTMIGLILLNLLRKFKTQPLSEIIKTEQNL